MTFLRNLLIGSLVLVINTLPPTGTWAEVTIPLPGLPSESLTVNYSLAIGSSHPNIPSDSQHPLLDIEGSSTKLSSLPYALNTQSPSSSPEHLAGDSQPNIPSNINDEEVPSYIIHQPSFRHRKAASQEPMSATSPSLEEQEINDQEFTDSQDDIADTMIIQTPLRNPQGRVIHANRLPSFPQLGWPFIEQDYGLYTLKNSATVFPDWFPETSVTGLPKKTINLARFGDVLNSDWEEKNSEVISEYGTIPLVINDAVAKNLRYFQEGITDRFQSYLDRFHHYKEIVEPIFQEFGLPTDLMYLSLVESGFNPRAFSRARASGPWQFMKATGRMYKLNVSWYVDERRDPIKSTVAAAHHLRDLYDRFGSWPLALAAYNAGSGKVSRAIRKTGTRDFWKIRRTRYIRRETKDYVPRFIAATLIAKNPTAYGFLPPEGDRHQFEEVLISKPVQLAAITKQTGISLEELKRLNPELRRNIVPKSKGPGYHLKVPVGMASLVTAHHVTFPVWTQPPPPPTQWYRVRRGDSLSVVARRFRMKVRQLKNMNNLSSNLIRVGARLRVRGGDEDYADDQIIRYRVRYGDSLGKIANRFGTSIRQLKKLNKLSTHLIYPGDRLRVRGTPPTKKSPTGDSKWYRIQRGDSLWSIAQQFRVSVRDLRALNKLSSSIIRAGHMLIVSQ
jgi:membrane-bound lytic murein transglycosylase D